MDLVNDLSNDLALALFVERGLARKLEGSDAKSFIARVEEELNRISAVLPRESENPEPLTVSINASH